MIKKTLYVNWYQSVQSALSNIDEYQLADEELTTVQTLSDDDIVVNILSRDNEDSEVEEPYLTSQEALDISTYFWCHDISTYLQ